MLWLPTPYPELMSRKKYLSSLKYAMALDIVGAVATASYDFSQNQGKLKKLDRYAETAKKYIRKKYCSSEDIEDIPFEKFMITKALTYAAISKINESE